MGANLASTGIPGLDGLTQGGLHRDRGAGVLAGVPTYLGAEGKRGQ